MPRYVALLRGINVGGNTMIKMEDLRAMFERLGFENVVSYINSGNIAFDSESQPEAELAATVEAAIEKHFLRAVSVLLREQSHIQTILANNPFAGQFESHKEMHVLFQREEMPAEKIEQLMAAVPDGERFAVHAREIYCYLPHGVAASLLGRGFIEKKLKVTVTARNWRTVERLSTL